MDEAAQRLYDTPRSFISSGLSQRNTKSVKSDEVAMAAMEEQWQFFVTNARDKALSHTRAARFWSRVDTSFGLLLIFLSACTTAFALLDGVPKEVLAGIGAVSTMLAAAASFLKSADRRQVHEKASRSFRSLMVKMMSCETERVYENLWADFNREITEEPIMPKRFANNISLSFAMTPELREIVEEKEIAIVKLENQKYQELDQARKAAKKSSEDEDLDGTYQPPVKEKWLSVVEIPELENSS